MDDESIQATRSQLRMGDANHATTCVDAIASVGFLFILASMSSDEILLAVDPSLRGTGYAILQRSAGKVRCLHFDVIKNTPKLSIPGCLLEIHNRLCDEVDRFQPTAMAVESVIYVQSFQTAITLGSARGAVLLAGAMHGLTIYEYAPRRVKQAVVGRGAAQKSQVAFMVRTLLGLTATPPPDAADAIAVGLTHFQSPPAAVRNGHVQRL